MLSQSANKLSGFNIHPTGTHTHTHTHTYKDTRTHTHTHTHTHKHTVGLATHIYTQRVSPHTKREKDVGNILSILFTTLSHNVALCVYLCVCMRVCVYVCVCECVCVCVCLF